MRKILAIGLDGATWSVLSPLLDRLPNIKKLMEKGVWGTLRSSLPPITFPAWKCYSMGKNPEKLGVYHWMDIDFKEEKFRFHRASSFKGKEIWDYLGEAGRKVGIINMPGTYPPREVNGFMVSGPFTTGLKYYYPRELKPLLKSLGYNPLVEFPLVDREEKILKDAQATITSRFALAQRILPRVDFLHLTIFCSDKLQHFCWDKEVVPKMWEFIDQRIGSLIKNLSQEWTVILFSDHGFQKVNRTFYVNNLFVQEGFLTLKRKISPFDLLYHLGLTVDNVTFLLKKLGIFSFIKRYLMSKRLVKLKTHLPTRRKEIGLISFENRIDWKKTKAIYNSFCVHINPRFNSRELQEELMGCLKEVKDPETGEEVVEDIYTKKELYPQGYLGQAPDLILKFKEHYHGRPHFLARGDLFGPPSHWIADHEPQGILVISGKNIRENEKIEGTNIVDLAPTILSLVNLPIPSDMDGKPLKDILKENEDLK